MPVPFPAPTFYLNSQRSFYVVHHTGILDTFFNSPEHGLQNCAPENYSLGSSPMAETNPLLARPNRPPHDHPIFLRVCHSPWALIPQKKLLLIRSALALYLTVAFILSFVYDHKYANRTSKLFPFYATSVSSFIQVLYYWITAVF